MPLLAGEEETVAASGGSAMQESVSSCVKKNVDDLKSAVDAGDMETCNFIC